MSLYPHLWCHECKAWVAVEPDRPREVATTTWSCATCGEQIACDECGAPWTNDHEHRTEPCCPHVPGRAKS